MSRAENILDPKILIDYIQLKEDAKGGAFTVRSKKTGKDYTFKIDKSVYNDKLYLWVYYEKNYLDFYKMGFYSDGKIVHLKEEVKTPTAQAIAWLLRQLFAGNNGKLQDVELLHLGNCIVCGRPLTDSNSIEAGIGSICLKKLKKGGR